MKIIKLADTHYIGVDDSEIKGGDWIGYPNLKQFVPVQYLGGDLTGHEKKITHSTQPLFTFNPHNHTDDEAVMYYDFVNGHSAVKPLSLSEVEEAIYGYSTYELFKKIDGSCEKGQYEHWLFEQGFNAHKELVKEKFFTIEDIMEAFTRGYIDGTERTKDITYYADKFHKSLLPKTEWECTIDEQGKIDINNALTK